MTHGAGDVLLFDNRVTKIKTRAVVVVDSLNLGYELTHKGEGSIVDYLQNSGSIKIVEPSNTIIYLEGDEVISKIYTYFIYE
jgi:hypothetical protein